MTVMQARGAQEPQINEVDRDRKQIRPTFTLTAFLTSFLSLTDALDRRE